MKTITYTGPLPSGVLLDVIERKEYPFQNGAEITVPDHLAEVAGPGFTIVGTVPTITTNEGER